MKILILFLSLYAHLGVSQVEPPSSSISSATTTTLEVRILGVEKTKGILEVALFNSRRKWLKKGKAFMQKRVEVDGKDVVVVFENLPKGEYALVSYHDLNSNNKLDKNFLGLPKEPYAMTRKAKSKLRKPYYKEMKFDCTEDHVLLETHLKTL